MTWQPIETAPKDGAWFVTARFVKDSRPEYEIGCYAPTMWPGFEPVEGTDLFRQVEKCIYEWTGFNNFNRATHWMPLPDPPQTP